MRLLPWSAAHISLCIHPSHACGPWHCSIQQYRCYTVQVHQSTGAPEYRCTRVHLDCQPLPLLPGAPCTHLVIDFLRYIRQPSAGNRSRQGSPRVRGWNSRCKAGVAQAAGGPAQPCDVHVRLSEPESLQSRGYKQPNLPYHPPCETSRNTTIKQRQQSTRVDSTGQAGGRAGEKMAGGKMACSAHSRETSRPQTRRPAPSPQPGQPQPSSWC